MQYIIPFSIWPYVAGFIVLINSSTLANIGLINGLVQLALFIAVVCIPVWRTGRMSYVDIGWPLGVLLIGVLTLALLQDGYWLRTLIVTLVYLLIGGRMGLGALHGLRKGWLDTELPRYQYQRIHWQNIGITNTRLRAQIEVLSQGVFNASFIALPAFIMAMNPSPSISYFEILGLCLWLAAFCLETLADRQKLAFLVAMKKANKPRMVCNVGLWRYTRHPNYFAEWMVWNSLVIAAIPSWLALYSAESLIIWVLLGVGLLMVSYGLFATLVSYTGAVPSEYYSLQKRPGYKAYQLQTNQFFPGPRKTTLDVNSDPAG